MDSILHTQIYPRDVIKKFDLLDTSANDTAGNLTAGIWRANSVKECIGFVKTFENVGIWTRST
jgi:hypothetical protein